MTFYTTTILHNDILTVTYTYTTIGRDLFVINNKHWRMSDAVLKIYMLPISTSIESALFLFVEEHSVPSLCHPRDHPPQGGNPVDRPYPSPRFTQL